MFRCTWLWVVPAVVACSEPRARPSPSLPAALRADLDAQLDRAFARAAVVPGLAVAVYTPRGVYVRTLGTTDVESRVPVTEDTAFYIASSTKSFTALAMAILADRGELDLDAPLARFAPDAPFPASVHPDAVTLRNLLTHTHGLDNGPIAQRVAATGQHDPDTLWRLLAATEPNKSAPLGRFQYTNVGYNILTVLTDRRLGVRWQDLLQRELFAPAGMTRTTALMSRARAERWSVAHPHEAATGIPQRIYLEKVDRTMQSAGGLIMSARDAARWLELVLRDGELAGRRVVPATAVRETRRPLAVTSERYGTYTRDHYGLGWYIGRYRDEVLVHHFGGFAGAHAHISYMPARGIGVAAFTNIAGPPADLVDAIANYVYDRTAERADAVATLDAALARIADNQARLVERVRTDRAARGARPWTLTLPRPAYAGVYRSERYGSIEITADGDALRVAFGELHAIAEPYTQPDSIRVELMPLNGEPIAFVLADGAPVALTYSGERFSSAARPARR
jgi:CubicO group peptidase (beta-lactamase class C family)